MGSKINNALDVTFLMPCLNEAETIETCIKKAQEFLKRNNLNGEVLIADNGSVDGSQLIAKQNNAKLIDVKTKGYGSALKAGIQQARGKFIIMGDADDSYAFNEVDSFYAALLDSFELVVGNRFRGKIFKNAMPFLHKYLGNPILSFLGRALFGAKIGDFHCGLRAFNRESILKLKLKTDGMEFASEMIIRATQENLSVAEVPVNLYPDGRSRSPHIRTWRDGWRHFKFILMLSPRSFMYYFGLTLFCIGALFSALLFKDGIELFGVQFNTRTFIMTTMLAVSGVIIVITSDILDKLYLVNFLGRKSPSRFNIFLMRTEIIQLIGIIFILLGSSIFAMVLNNWFLVNFGQMESDIQTKKTLLSSALILIGFILITFSFVSDLLNYLGKND
ncbi:MAG: glycosyltransferase family 2 protein [Pseudomonadota bacterium]|nr:glycosyltransferase family 2 protein [Pseudomonadota bacterium]